MTQPTNFIYSKLHFDEQGWFTAVGKFIGAFVGHGIIILYSQ